MNEHELYNERAAIMEYDGNLSRAIAEREARKDVQRYCGRVANARTAYPNGCPILSEGPNREDL